MKTLLKIKDRTKDNKGFILRFEEEGMLGKILFDETPEGWKVGDEITVDFSKNTDDKPQEVKQLDSVEGDSKDEEVKKEEPKAKRLEMPASGKPRRKRASKKKVSPKKEVEVKQEVEIKKEEMDLREELITHGGVSLINDKNKDVDTPTL